MGKNVSAIDRIIRSVFSIAILLVLLSTSVSGVFAIILWSVAVVLLVTGLLSICPTYRVFSYIISKVRG